jgi:hypothetical protein
VEFYSDAEEKIAKDLPASKEIKVKINVYVNSVHANDLVTRRSITEILVLLNIMPFDGYLSVRRQCRL